MYKHILLFLVLSLVFTSCSFFGGLTCEEGTGNIESQDRLVGEFKKIDISLSGNIYIKQGNNEYIRVDTDDNLQDNIIVEVEDNTLAIYTEGNICPTSITVFITFTDIDEIEKFGSSNIISDGSIELDKLELESQGSGDVNIGELKCNEFDGELEGSGNMIIRNLEAETIFLEVEGSGDITVNSESDKSKYLKCELTGSGDIDAKDLQTENAEIEMIGSGNFYLNATETLNLKMMGSGDLFYKGQPRITSEIVGSGTIKRLDD